MYSGGAGATHNPPLSLVFKKLDAWSTTMDLEIVLKNSDGVIVSSYKAKAETSTEYLEEGDQRACSLMWSRDFLGWDITWRHHVWRQHKGPVSCKYYSYYRTNILFYQWLYNDAAYIKLYTMYPLTFYQLFCRVCML